MFQRAAFALGVTGFIATLIRLAGGSFQVIGALAVFAGAVALLRIGESLLPASAGCRFDEARLPAAFCLGASAASVVVLAIGWFTNLPAAWLFGGFAAGFEIVRFVLNRLTRNAGDAPPDRSACSSLSAGSASPPETTKPIAWPDIVATFVFAALVVWFSRGVASSLPHLYETGVLSAWVDYYLHAGTIAQFGDPLAIGRGDLAMADLPRGFYHYAPFILPATLSPLTDLPPLGLATAALLPIGLLIGCLGAYVLATELAGRSAALFVTLLVMCVPDASSYGLHNGFFGFHWLLFTAPGSGYAIGISCLAIALAVRWRRQSSHHAACLVAIGLTVSLILFRAHFFLLLAPALACVIAAGVWPQHRRTLRAVIGAGAIAVMAMLWLQPTVRTLWIAYSQTPEFLQTMHSRITPTAYTGLYDRLAAIQASPALLWSTGVGLLIVAALGGWLVVYLLLVIALRLRHEFQDGDGFPALLIGVFACLVVLSPVASNGDASEYKQRAFVLLYTVCAVYCGCLFARSTGLATRWATNSRQTPVLLLFAAAAVTSAWVSQSIDPARPRSDGSETFYLAPTDPDLLAAGRYIRSHARPYDTFALGGPDAKGWLIDPATVVTSLTALPAYLARSEFQLRRADSTAQIARERIDRIKAISDAAELHKALTLMKESRIDWLVMPRGQSPTWDPAGRQAAFRHGGTLVYHTGPTGLIVNSSFSR